MAFKKAPPGSLVPDSPERLFLDLPRRKFPDVLPHQQEIMRTYKAEATEEPDVALQLPTGSGKTLVGLLIGEWLRRKNNERVVYLAPTRQLVNQVVEQAEEKYGLTVLGFTGKKRHYAPATKAAYQNADRLAVTTYSSLFNTNPFFRNADILILDDVHTAENYVANLWSVFIERDREEHATLLTAVRGVIRPLIEPTNLSRLASDAEQLSDRAWVDKIPTPRLAEVKDGLVEVLDANVVGLDLAYPWAMIRSHLDACHVYLSPQGILIRPLIPPTWSHAPFEDPRQRIYMSATLGAGGDLERLMGRRRIRRLPIPEGWDRQGVGRRFFIFPGMAFAEEGVAELRRALMRRAERSLVLVPSDRLRQAVAEDVETTLAFRTFSADDIELSKKPFISTSPAVAVVASRYDGIDFPGNECRLLFVEGLPKAMNLQERFIMARMGASLLFNERVQTRVLQAIGRCTRSLEDYSCVVVSGEELPDYLADRRRRRFLHPELQAEIEFGVQQSIDTTLEDIIENFGIFLENGATWEDVNQQIVARRKRVVQDAFPAIDQLGEVVGYELEFQSYLWQQDHESALGSAKQVLAGLQLPELRGYRALWHYLAGSAAWLGARAGVTGFAAEARRQFFEAKGAAIGIPWLVSLSRYHDDEPQQIDQQVTILQQIERLEAVLESLGTLHNRAFARREKEILEGLRSKEKGPFEDAHKRLGELLGFDAHNVETDGSPDPWWIAGNVCLVFEDHAGAEEDSILGVSKARQTAGHPQWIRANVEVNSAIEILPVLVTPVTRVGEGAVPHLSEVALWPLSEFCTWARQAIGVVREVRKTFMAPGDLAWRASAAERFVQHGLDAPGLLAMLRSRPALESLTRVQ